MGCDIWILWDAPATCDLDDLERDRLRIHQGSFQSHVAKIVSSVRRGSGTVCDGSLAILGLPYGEDVVRTPKEGAGSIFTAQS